MKKKLFAVFFVSVITPLLAFADLTNVCDIVGLIDKAKNIFAFIVFAFAVIAILYSALLFLTSGGDPEKVAKGRSSLIWGLVGIAVALFASYAIPFVANVVGGTAVSQCTF